MKPRRVVLYARVSTSDQNADSQLTAMREACARRGFTIVAELTDQVTGDVEGRRAKDTAYRELMASVKRNRFDCVMVFKYDRLARSLVALVDALDYFGQHGVQFISLTEDVDTTTPQGRLFFSIIASFAEYERAIIRERVNAGLANARRKGIKLGRPRDRATELRVDRLAQKGLKISAIARAVKRSRAGVRLMLDRLADAAAVPGIMSMRYERDEHGECPNCGNGPHGGPCKRGSIHVAGRSSTDRL
jgi:putative DNA-invertase from lambdoid prophage Rac